MIVFLGASLCVIASGIFMQIGETNAKAINTTIGHKECSGPLMLAPGEDQLILFPPTIDTADGGRPPSLTCDGLFKGSDGGHVVLEFVTFDLPDVDLTGLCNHGYVQYGYYNAHGHRVVRQKLCGSVAPPQIVSQRSWAWVSMVAVNVDAAPWTKRAGVKLRVHFDQPDPFNIELFLLGVIFFIVVPLSCICPFVKFVNQRRVKGPLVTDSIEMHRLQRQLEKKEVLSTYGDQTVIEPKVKVSAKRKREPQGRGSCFSVSHGNSPQYEEIPSVRIFPPGVSYVRADNDSRRLAVPDGSYEHGSQASYNTRPYNQEIYSQSYWATPYPDFTINIPDSPVRDWDSVPHRPSPPPRDPYPIQYRDIARQRDPIPIPSRNPDSIRHQDPMPIPSRDPDSILHRDPIPIPSLNPDSIQHRDPMPIPSRDPDSILHRDPMSIPSRDPCSIRQRDSIPIPSRDPYSTRHRDPIPIPSRHQDSIRQRDPMPIPSRDPGAPYHLDPMPIQPSDPHLVWDPFSDREPDPVMIYGAGPPSPQDSFPVDRYTPDEPYRQDSPTYLSLPTSGSILRRRFQPYWDLSFTSVKAGGPGNVPLMIQDGDYPSEASFQAAAGMRSTPFPLLDMPRCRLGSDVRAPEVEALFEADEESEPAPKRSRQTTNSRRLPTLASISEHPELEEAHATGSPYPWDPEGRKTIGLYPIGQRLGHPSSLLDYKSEDLSAEDSVFHSREYSGMDVPGMLNSSGEAVSKIVACESGSLDSVDNNVAFRLDQGDSVLQFRGESGDEKNSMSPKAPAASILNDVGAMSLTSDLSDGNVITRGTAAGVPPIVVTNERGEVTSSDRCTPVLELDQDPSAPAGSFSTQPRSPRAPYVNNTQGDEGEADGDEGRPSPNPGVQQLRSKQNISDFLQNLSRRPSVIRKAARGNPRSATRSCSSGFSAISPITPITPTPQCPFPSPASDSPPITCPDQDILGEALGSTYVSRTPGETGSRRAPSSVGVSSQLSEKSYNHRTPRVDIFRSVLTNLADLNHVTEASGRYGTPIQAQLLPLRQEEAPIVSEDPVGESHATPTAVKHQRPPWQLETEIGSSDEPITEEEQRVESTGTRHKLFPRPHSTTRASPCSPWKAGRGAGAKPLASKVTFASQRTGRKIHKRFLSRSTKKRKTPGRPRDPTLCQSEPDVVGVPLSDVTHYCPDGSTSNILVEFGKETSC